MTDFLTQKRQEIEARLQELRPLHDEFTRLERARAALEGLDAPSSPKPAPGASRRGRPRRGTGRPGRPVSATDGRRGRRAGGRAGEALELVRQNPGISVADIADRLGMKQRNYLYRIMANLQSEGAVDKQGQGFVAT